MKTFDEIKDVEEYSLQSRIESSQTEYTREWFEKCYDNVDEFVTMRIGADFNHGLEEIQRQYINERNKYGFDFARFIMESNIEKCFGSIHMSKEELLSCITDKDISYDFGRLFPAFRDLLTVYVNSNMGMNIPTADYVEEVTKNYIEHAYEENTEEKKEAYIALREMQRDSGALFYKGNLNFLSEDKKYLEYTESSQLNL